jgi:hypothetical protein
MFSEGWATLWSANTVGTRERVCVHLPAPNLSFHLAPKVYPQCCLILIHSRTHLNDYSVICRCLFWVSSHACVTVLSKCLSMKIVLIWLCQVSHLPNHLSLDCVHVCRIHPWSGRWEKGELGLSFLLVPARTLATLTPRGSLQKCYPTPLSEILTSSTFPMWLMLCGKVTSFCRCFSVFPDWLYSQQDCKRGREAKRQTDVSILSIRFIPKQD